VLVQIVTRTYKEYGNGTRKIRENRRPVPSLLLRTLIAKVTLADFRHRQRSNKEFPPTWQVFLDEDFETATPQVEGMATMELMAQVRHTGRMLGNSRIAMGGEARLKVDFSCSTSPDPRYPSPGNRH
jgi:hypothetical protein